MEFIGKGQGRVLQIGGLGTAPGCIHPLQYQSLRRRQRVMHRKTFWLGGGAALPSSRTERTKCTHKWPIRVRSWATHSRLPQQVAGAQPLRPCYCMGPSRPVPPQCLQGSAPVPRHRRHRLVFIQSSSLILGCSSDSSTFSLLAAQARWGRRPFRRSSRRMPQAQQAAGPVNHAEAALAAAG